MIWSTFTFSFTTQSTRTTTLCSTVRWWIRSCGFNRTTSSILLSDLRNVLRNCSTVSCCTRQRAIWWDWRFLPTLCTGTSTGIVRTASSIFAMTCGNIQSSLASASCRLDAITEDYHFAYISQLLSRRTVIECVSSLAYSNILDRVHWVIYLQHQLVAFVDARVWPSTVVAVSVSSCIGPTVINDPARVPEHEFLTVSTGVKIILADLISSTQQRKRKWKKMKEHERTRKKMKMKENERRWKEDERK